MTSPVYEQEAKGYTWRIGIEAYRGKYQISIWPWYMDRKTGRLAPGKNGLKVPLERIHEVMAIMEQGVQQLPAKRLKSVA